MPHNPESLPENSCGFRVSAVTVTWNSAETVCGCIASILNEIPDAEIVVSDNSSADSTVGTVQSRFPGTRVLENGVNTGFAAGMNAGIREALKSKPDFLLLINPDAELLPGSIEAMIAEFRRNPDAGIVAPALYGRNGGPQKYAFGMSPDLPHLVKRGLWRIFTGKALHDWGTDKPDGWDWVSCACVLVRVELFTEDNVWFDERFFMYFEDADWCMRAGRKRKIRRAVSASVKHIGGASLVRNPDAAGEYFKSMKLYVSLYSGNVAAFAVGIFYRLYKAVRH